MTARSKVNDRLVAFDEEKNEWYYEDDNSVLTPEDAKPLREKANKEKAKFLRMQTVNDDIKAASKVLSEKHNIKIQVCAYDIELDEVGVWHSENVNYMDVLGFKTANSSAHQ